MSKIVQLPGNSFKFQTIPLPLAILNVRAEDLASRLGLKLEEWQDDLAPQKGFVVQFENGLYAFFYQDEHLIESGKTKGPTIDIDSFGVDFSPLNQNDVAEDFKNILNYILENIGLTLDDVQTKRIDAENWSCGFRG